ncbi:16480_t:CDS:2, partial [Funneliformis geosporum]
MYGVSNLTITEVTEESKLVTKNNDQEVDANLIAITGSGILENLQPCAHPSFGGVSKPTGTKVSNTFLDIKVEILFDEFLPRIVELVDCKIVACKLLHSIIIIMVGKSAFKAGPHQTWFQILIKYSDYFLENFVKDSENFVTDAMDIDDEEYSVKNIDSDS